MNNFIDVKYKQITTSIYYIFNKTLMLVSEIICT
jgi:hypothetical protein